MLGVAIISRSLWERLLRRYLERCVARVDDIATKFFVIPLTTHGGIDLFFREARLWFFSWLGTRAQGSS